MMIEVSLGDFPDWQRRFMVLRVAGLKPKPAARVLECNPQTIKTASAYIRARLNAKGGSFKSVIEKWKLLLGEHYAGTENPLAAEASRYSLREIRPGKWSFHPDGRRTASGGNRPYTLHSSFRDRVLPREPRGVDPAACPSLCPRNDKDRGGKTLERGG